MNSIYKLIIELVGKDKGASRELKQTQQEVKGLTGAAGQLQGALQAAGALGLAYMAKEAISAAWELGKLGAEATQQAAAFEELARQAGGSSDAIIAAPPATIPPNRGSIRLPAPLATACVAIRGAVFAACVNAVFSQPAGSLDSLPGSSPFSDTLATWSFHP